MKDTETFLNQYEDHVQTTGFGVPGQEALTRSRMLVIGAGALASPMLSYLTSMGVGSLGIVSDEKIRKSDLPSQPVFGSGQEGKLKSQILASRLRETNPEVKVNLHEQGLNRDNVLSLIAGYDLVIDTTNIPGMSLLINDACVISGKPMIYGSLDFPSGHFSVLNYKGGATLRCLLQNQDAGILIRQPQKVGLATLPALISCMMANEAIKIVSEIGNIASNKLLSFNVFSNQLTSIRLEPVSANQALTTLLSDYAPTPTDNLSKPSRIRSISPKLLDIKIKYKEPLQLIDLRQNPPEPVDESWNYLHIPEETLLSDLERIHQDIIVVLISENGEEAQKLATLLNERHGFDNIHYLEGGMEAWNKQRDGTSIDYENI
ncbi:HesA/MoeB/ThiF family protein [Arcticibacter pallidicorallinus]|nr:HesA/MoeB/ThiF family protein [Arcticibacter pallidicorallinus]